MSAFLKKRSTCPGLALTDQNLLAGAPESAFLKLPENHHLTGSKEALSLQGLAILIQLGSSHRMKGSLITANN